MASQAWIDIVNANRTAKTKTINSFDSLNNYLAGEGIKQNKRSSNTYRYGPLCKTLSKNNTESGKSSTTSRALVNVKLTATAGDNNKITLSTIEARSTDKDGDSVKTGLITAYDYAIVAGVAAACGYSIGWSIASDYCSKLLEDGFDWGFSSISNDGHPVELLLGTPSGTAIKTYIDYDLFNRLVKKLEEYGLWDIDPSGVVPLDPVIGTKTQYDFQGRIPAFPSQYYDDIERLINEEINPQWVPIFTPHNITPNTNEYFLISVLDDGTVEVLIVENNDLKIDYRSPLINTGDVFTYSEVYEDTIAVTIDFSGDYTYMYRYRIDPDGTISKIGTYWDGYGRKDIRASFDPDRTCAVYDSFGASYRELTWRNPEHQSVAYGVNVGEITGDYSQVVIDDNAIDLREANIQQDLPTVWAQRLYASAPIISDKIADYPTAANLNHRLTYIPIKVADKAIDPNSTQADSLTGLTDGDLLDDLIDDTFEFTPRIGVDPDPIPTDDPPKETPPVPTLPDGIAAFIKIYSLAEGTLQSFANWLWDIHIEDFLPIVNKPMDAIIGLHAIYATPALKSSESQIDLGNLHYTASVDAIKQYASLECGNVTINPHFKNINDYVATKIQLYLPFIGFVDLQPSEVMGRLIYVDYHIDFLTGACTAFVKIKDTALSGPFTAYTYSGNCAVEIPITGLNYADICRNVISTAGGVALAAATGGVTAPLLAGNAGSIISSQLPIERSGNIGSNAGAMGIRSPFIIITRNFSVDAKNREHFEGKPQNINARLGSLSGYTRVKYINLEGLACTEEEKADILSKLQGGVFI